MHRILLTALAALLLAPASAAAPPDADVRFATFNASLNRNFAGQFVSDISTPNNVQAKNAAETIQRVRPDVLLINEFDFDAAGDALRLFQDNYLSIGQSGAAPIVYPYRYAAESNTGHPVRIRPEQQRRDRRAGRRVRLRLLPGTVRHGRLLDVPDRPDRDPDLPEVPLEGHAGQRSCPDDPATPAPADWYSPAEQNVFRLSSKSHWDLPILVGGKVVHFLTSHPTPPVFDGPEDRNGTRNYDEIRFWADYITPGKSGYIYDDGGRHGWARSPARCS